MILQFLQNRIFNLEKRTCVSCCLYCTWNSKDLFPPPWLTSEALKVNGHTLLRFLINAMVRKSVFWLLDGIH